MLNRLHVILSAELKGNTKEENIARTGTLRSYLSRNFANQFEEVTGYYLGSTEKAFIVQCKDHRAVGDLFEMANTMSQDCIMLVDPAGTGFLLHADLKMERLGPVIASEWLPDGLKSYTYNPVSKTYYYTL